MTQTVLAVLQQILPGYFVISVVIQFPKSAVQNIKVLVGKVLGDFVDVFLLVDLAEYRGEVRFSYLSDGDFARVAEVDGVKDSGDDGDGVLVLEFGVVG